MYPNVSFSITLSLRKKNERRIAMYSTLEAERRIVHGEKSLSKTRSEGFTPIVVYGKDMESIPMQVVTKKLSKLLTQDSAIVEIIVAGSNEKLLVNIDQVQRTNLTAGVMHVTFKHLNQNEDATIALKVHIHGTAKGIAKGGTVHVHHDLLHVKGRPQNLPGHIEIDVAGLNLDEEILAKDIVLPKGVSIVDKPETVVVTCHALRVREEAEAVETEAETVEGSTPAATDKE